MNKICVLLMVLMFISAVYAEIPHQISYQARLTDDTGAPLDGEYQLTFTIYDMPEGGNALWTSGAQTVLVADGLFEYDMGSHVEIPDSVFLQHFERWLGITIGTDPELIPRTFISSVAFAYRAQFADGAGFTEGAGHADHATYSDTATYSFSGEHALNADQATNAGHATYADTASYAQAVPGGGFTLPYAGSVTDANIAFAVDNEGTGPAIRGDSEAEDGVIGWTGESTKSGVYGYSISGIGVSGRAEGENHGVYGESNSSTPDYAGVRGHNLGSGPGVSAYGSDIGLYAEADDAGIAGMFNGDVLSTGKLVISTDTGTAGRFVSDTMTIADSGVVFAKYTGQGMGTFPAAVIGISHTTDTLGMGGYFEGDYIGLMAQIYQEEDMRDRIGMWSWVEGGTDANRNTGVRAEAVGKGNSVNWGVDALAESGDFNYGVMVKAQEDMYGIYPAITNVGGYFEAVFADTCIVIDAYTNAADSISYGVRSQVYNAPTNYAGHFTAASGDVNYGIYTEVSGGTYNYAIYAKAPTAINDWAGLFDGDVNITGTLYGGKNATKIDHPLDPENKYLIHSAVESPDMMNVYSGNIVTDENGRAKVALPDYFEALNRDFRYQLTVIGEFAQAIISEEIHNNQFGILTDRPYIKVSWQVTGIRDDASAQARKMQVEIDKPEPERGTYLDPAAFGLGEEFGIHYQEHLRRSIDRDVSPIEQRHNLQGRRERSER